MKNKILIIVLSFLLLLSTTVFSEKDDIKHEKIDTQYDIANTLLTSIDENFSLGEDEMISRGEFLYNLVLISGFSQSEYEEGSYNDVSHEDKYAPAIATALTYGWIQEADKFCPDDKITLGQAVKIGVCMTGYKKVAEYKGGWYYGYQTVAQDNKLLTNISNIKNNDELSNRDACVLIYNILNAQAMEYIGEETTYKNKTEITSTENTILEKYHDIYSTTGIVSSDSITSLYNESILAKGYITIDKEKYKYSGKDDLLGYNVKAFYKKDNSGNQTIVCMFPYKSNVVEFSNTDFDETDGYSVKYLSGELKKTAKLDRNFYYLKNGKLTSVTNLDLKKIFEQKSSRFKLIDNNEDGTFDILVAEIFKYTYVSAVDLFNGYIYDAYSHENLIDLSDEECVYTVKSTENGEYFDADIEEIIPGLVVASAASDDNKHVELIICYDFVKGTMTEADEEKITIGETKYYKSQYFNENCIAEFGKEMNFLIGINNEVVAVEKNADDSIKYAWLIKLWNNEKKDTECIGLFSQTNEVLQFEFADKVFIDGKRVGNGSVKGYIETNVDLTKDDNRLFKYRLNSENMVDMLDFVVEKKDDVTSATENYEDNNSIRLSFSGSYLYRPGPYMFSSKFNVKNTNYIFVIPPEDQRNDYSLYDMTTKDYFENSKSYDIKAYDVDLEGCAGAAVIVGKSSGNSAKVGIKAVIEEIVTAVNYEEQACKALHIKETLGFKTIYFDPEKKYAVDLSDLSPGDIISYTADGHDVIRDITVCYDFSDHSVNSIYTVEDGEQEFNEGFLYSKSGDYLYIVEPDKTNPYIPAVPSEMKNGRFRNIALRKAELIYVNVKKSSDGKEIEKVKAYNAPDDELCTYLQSGSNASFIVCYKEYNLTYEIFVYDIEY